VPEVAVLGPAAAPLSRLRGRFRWHLLLKAPQPRMIGDVLRRALDRVRLGREVTVVVDMDPVSLT